MGGDPASDESSLKATAEGRVAERRPPADWLTGWTMAIGWLAVGASSPPSGVEDGALPTVRNCGAGVLSSGVRVVLAETI